MNLDFETKDPIGPRPAGRFELERAVVAAFESWWAGPRDLLARNYFTEDATLRNHSPRHLSAFGGEHFGRGAIVQIFRQLASEFHFSQPNISSILTDGRHAAVAYSIHLRHIGTCKSGRVCGMAHVTFDDNLRVKSLENFFDSAAMAEIGEMLEGFAARSDALDRTRRAALTNSFKRSL